MFTATPDQTTSSSPPTSRRHGVPPPAPARATAYTHADIAQRAYDIYVRSGFLQGHSEKNWQRAEKDLRDRGAVACQEEHHKKEMFAPDATPDSTDDR